jgi:aminoglycoside phosphotransferase family enzyme/gluconate kinase
MPRAMHDDPHAALVRALQNPALYDHPVRGFELVETHISSVLLTGDYAYKLKKPLDLGFLDFSTLEKRRHFCHEELRLNRRLAPQIYLEVLPITGTPENPRLKGPGEPFEYAVKMRQFPQAAQLDRVLARGSLKPAHIDQLARTLAEFHARVAVAGPETAFGTPAAAYFPMGQNFDQIRPLVSAAFHPQLARLQTWSERERDRLTETLAARKRDGFVRECHGDVHLANLALLDEQVVIFDCLEFNDNLRWIDVMNEVAFTVMDLDDRGQRVLARRFLNAYLEHAGDYAGLALLRFYQVYRALVRAKVSVIRLGQPGLGSEERAQIENKYRGYADLAERYTQPTKAALLITHGLSGSGKSTLTQALVERLGAVRVRSDVERKRLYGMTAEQRSGSALNGGLYTADAGTRTYERLAELARAVVNAGHTVMLDATFLKRTQRERLRALAQELRAPFLILAFEATEATLRERVAARTLAGVDASEAGLTVLEHQRASAEPLTAAEQEHALVITTDQLPADAELGERVLRRLAAAGAVL